MLESDGEAIRKSLVFVDNETALHEAGELVEPIARL
jgi:hypothetical protein